MRRGTPTAAPGSQDSVRRCPISCRIDSRCQPCGTRRRAAGHATSTCAGHTDGFRRRPAACRDHDGRRAARRRGGYRRPSIRRSGRSLAGSRARGGGNRSSACVSHQRRETFQVGATRQAADPRQAQRRARSPPADRGSRRRSRSSSRACSSVSAPSPRRRCWAGTSRCPQSADVSWSPRSLSV